MALLDRLIAADQAAFLAVNGAHTEGLDVVMTAVSDLRIWFPLYILFLVLIKLLKRSAQRRASSSNP